MPSRTSSEAERLENKGQIGTERPVAKGLHNEGLQSSQIATQAEAWKLYAERIESLYVRTLDSRSWRLTAPFRRWRRKAGGGGSRTNRLVRPDGRVLVMSRSGGRRSIFFGGNALWIKILKAVYRRTARLFGYEVPISPPRAPGQPARVTAKQRGPAPRADQDALAADYAASPIAKEPDSFVLYRIIGNDLHPRHRKGQSRENLAFILENEPQLEGCEKRFVVNRIVEKDEEAAILELLAAHGCAYIHLPFDADAYRAVPWDVEDVPEAFAPYARTYCELHPDERSRIEMRLYRHKNNAVMNNNGARNVALNDGRGRAKWVLPFDGNCFITAEAWRAIRQGVLAKPHCPYHLVPMARILDNADLLQPGFSPTAQEEPQMLFRRDAECGFDEAFPYGRRPKVELFWRLGVPGAWDSWPIEKWDLPAPPYSRDAGKVARSGWVARLFSGQTHLEQTGGTKALIDRGLARNEAVELMLAALDERVQVVPDAAEPVFVTRDPLGDALPDTLRQSLLTMAESAMFRGPFSVTEKTTLPPSREPHDYWHPAPYYWPHPLGFLGFPDMRRDGRRVPGTNLYEPLSDRYDRTRLQYLFDDTFVLALAHRETGDPRFAEHAARNVRTWFVDPATAMTPHLNYAQVRRGHNNNLGSSSGIIEMKDLYYFLDAVRLLTGWGALGESETRSFHAWLARYLGWLQSSSQGTQERGARNNHGTYYDLQVAAIATYLGDGKLTRMTLRDSRMRIVHQILPDGRQPEELRRATTAHYCCFNLEGWVHLAQLGAAVGEDLWGFQSSDGRSIGKAIEWLMQYLGKPWPFQQIDEFDRERFFPLYHAYAGAFGKAPVEAPVPPAAEIKPIFYPHDGIRPFWQIR